MRKKLNMLKESISMSLTNIYNNKMRSFLTTLGVLIGVTAIIALITVMQGATSKVYAQFSALGTGKLTAQIQGTPLKSGLNQNDLKKLEKLDNISAISPSVPLTLRVKSDNNWAEEVEGTGYGEAYFRNTENVVSRGRPLNYLDEKEGAPVCLMDEHLSKKLFLGEDPLYQNITILGNTYTVVGIISSDANQDVISQSMGKKESGKLYLPYTTALKISLSSNINQLTLYIEDTDKTDDTVALLESELNALFNNKEDAFSIINMESLLDTMNTMMGMMTTLLAGIASIALLVGGIGIMNMMLVSVTERTNEIGLLKALGAEPKQIQLQFLIESFCLSLLGGIGGTVLGLLISYGLSVYIDMPFVLSGSAILIGVLFSASVGILFGWAPARKASNLNPIDALRSN